MLIKRETRAGANDLNTVYRPYTIDELVGNKINKSLLKNSLDSQTISHTLLFTGDPGCGKTTAARIVSLGLNCEEKISSEPCLVCPICKAIMNNGCMDVMEINVGTSNTKGDVTGIVETLYSAPFDARFKVVIFDEAHLLTPASVGLLLKILEDGFKHVYFIFCTDQPERIKHKAFHSRVTHLNFGKIPKSLIVGMLKNVSEFEGYGYSNEVLDLIANEADGVPRDSLVYLKMVEDEGSWNLANAKELLIGTDLNEDTPQVIDLCRTLMKAEWTESKAVFEGLKEALPTFTVEGVRRAVLGYMVSCLKRAKTIGEGEKFSDVIEILTPTIFESGKPAENKFYIVMFRIVARMSRK